MSYHHVLHIRAVLVVSTLILLCLSGRAEDVGHAVSAEGKHLRIVSSFYPMYIATLNVTKGAHGVEVRNLTTPQTGCLHDYQLSPDDMIVLSKADILVVNGVGMESFLDKAASHFPSLKIAQASEGIELLKDEAAEGGNPHVWVSVSLHSKQIANIAACLSKLDPSRATLYQKNAADYSTCLEALRTKMRDSLKNAPASEIITFHEAFPYFAKELSLRIAAVIEREPGSDPSPAELAEVIDIVRRKKVKALFAEPQYSTRAAETIARETGAKLYTLDPVVTGPDDPDAYIRIMEKNLETLRTALGVK